MKILVTGSTGFVGHNVVQWLIEHGYNPIVTATNEDKAKKYAWYSPSMFIPCDYYNEKLDYYSYFGKPDLLIHLAWRGSPHRTNCSMRYHLEDNLPAEMQFLQSFISSGKTKIVGIGTVSEYGNIDGCLKETMLTNPTTYYSTAKDTLRRYLELVAEEKKISWNWIRLFFMYGEGQNPQSLLPMLDAAITRGDKMFNLVNENQKRDYLPVMKSAEYICRIALQNNYNGIINCCSGHSIPLVELTNNYVKSKHASIQLIPNAFPSPTFEGADFWGDTTRLNMVLKSFRK